VPLGFVQLETKKAESKNKQANKTFFHCSSLKKSLPIKYTKKENACQPKERKSESAFNKAKASYSQEHFGFSEAFFLFSLKIRVCKIFN
jgi:hypothetical protein